MSISFPIIKKLGSGSFGDVVLAKTPKTMSYYPRHPYVAIKMLKNSNHSEAKHEAKLLSTLKHEGIVQYLDMMSMMNVNHTVCLFMEYCEYGTLQDFIQNGSQTWNVVEHIGAKWLLKKYRSSVFDEGYLIERQAWGALYQLSNALNYLHNLHPPIIHRDLKPANILRQRSGPEGKYHRLKIGDFGMAKVVGEKKCQDIYYTRSKAGTEIYLAPEILNEGRVTTYTDIFSLGAIASFTCNRGKHLFHNCIQISSWEGGKSTLNRDKYSITFRQLVANMMNPMAQSRPDAKLIERTCHDNFK